MTIELTRGHDRYVYRVNPQDARLIDRRVNKRGARWQAFRLLPSATEARQALMKLTGKERTQ